MPCAAACAASAAVGKLRRRQCVPCSDPCAAARRCARLAVSYARAASMAVVYLEGAAGGVSRRVGWRVGRRVQSID